MEANGFVFALVMPRQVRIAMLNHRSLLSHTYNPAVFEEAVEAIHQQDLPAMEQRFGFLHQEVSP